MFVVGSTIQLLEQKESLLVPLGRMFQKISFAHSVA